jgi:prepilin-type N-terminal cleavage/methylation domain-containing protein
MASGKSSLGFTLIEILIAVMILSVISAIGFVGYSSAQKVARDSIRKRDLKSIQVGLELYYEKKGHYPLYTHYIGCDNVNDKSCALHGDWLHSCYYTGSNFKCLPSNQGAFWIHDDSLNEHLDSNFINVMPIDPLNNSCCNGSAEYIYFYKTEPYIGCPGEGKWYMLMAKLENQDDPDTIRKKPVTWCDGVTKLDGLTSATGLDYWMYPNTYIVQVNQ